MRRIITVLFFVNILLVVGVLIFLTVYSNGAYLPLTAQQDAIDALVLDDIERVDESTSISYRVDDPIAQIIFFPGGLVEAESYEFLAANLALEGYDVTIFKAFFNLAILTPNYARRFLSEDVDNILIGHSLGGTVASMLANGRDDISTVIFLASYPIRDVSDKNVLMITAENDGLLEQSQLDSAEERQPSDVVYFEIEGGNHAQFGWYGDQIDDNQATITVEEQQAIILTQILDFITTD